MTDEVKPAPEPQEVIVVGLPPHAMRDELKRREQLISERDGQRRAREMTEADLDRTRAERDALKAEVARLREALTDIAEDVDNRCGAIARAALGESKG